MKLLNKIKHIFDKKTYEFQIYVNEKETILIHKLKKKQIKNKITYQFIENKIVNYYKEDEIPSFNDDIFYISVNKKL